MKKVKLITVAVVCLLFTGCKEYGEKRIVNFVTADSDKIAVYYYDFSKEEPGYIREEKENKGIKDTLVQILSEEDYNLKLCKYAVVSKDITGDSINELFFGLTDCRFAPDIIILEGETNLDPEEYEKADRYAYPLYNYKVKETLVTGTVEKLNGNEKNIIIAGKLYKQLDGRQSFVFDILNRTKKQGIYVFENKGEILSAELEAINCYQFIKNNALNINITAVMKSYKGMPSEKQYKKTVEVLLEKDICKNIEDLISDEQITENFDLLWKVKNVDYDKITINVNIL
ncbi:MAG: hypothetical protein IKA10_07950 [Oscillospiraceae bacterium]|nr:hypothetical protein [Oscillospiraceae bacterium]